MHRGPPGDRRRGPVGAAPPTTELDLRQRDAGPRHAEPQPCDGSRSWTRAPGPPTPSTFPRPRTRRWRSADVLRRHRRRVRPRSVRASGRVLVGDDDEAAGWADPGERHEGGIFTLDAEDPAPSSATPPAPSPPSSAPSCRTDIFYDPPPLPPGGLRRRAGSSERWTSASIGAAVRGTVRPVRRDLQAPARQGRLREEDVDEVLREIRVALLEADVNFVVRQGHARPHPRAGRRRRTCRRR